MNRKRKIIEFAKSLHLLGKARITDTGPEMLGQRIMIVPRELFTEFIDLYREDPEMEQTMYRTMKKSVYSFCADLDDDRDLEPAELLNTLLKLTKLNGFGHIEINDYDREMKEAVFYVRNLPSDELDDTEPFKGDTYWSGMLAGGMSYVFQQDVECLETQCMLEGENSCKFLVAPKTTLRQRHPQLFREKFPAETRNDARTPSPDTLVIGE